jgi:hypothetical protein
MRYGELLEKLSANYYIGEHSGSRKPNCYLEEYDRLFHTRRNDKLRIVELGVQAGWSMLMWRDYFPNSIIIGLDNSEIPSNFPNESRFHFFRGDQSDPVVLAKIIDVAGGPIDLIIDDASHHGYLTARSFKYLFDAVCPGGYYIIEDIGTSFTGSGGFDDAPFVRHKIESTGQPKTFPSHQNGIVGFVKQLADYTQESVALKTVRWHHCPIYRVSFLPNMAVIEKAPTSLIGEPAGHI